MSRFIVSRLLRLIVWGILLPASVAMAAPVTGKVAVDGKGVAGVRVMAFPQATLALAGEAPFTSPASSADGLFTLDLPPGGYYLLASGNGWFSYYGRNPLTVPAEGLADINLPLVPAATPPPVKM